MAALFASFYCPNAGRDGNHLLMKFRDEVWLVQRLPAGAKVPDWATHGWNLDPPGKSIQSRQHESSDLSDSDLIEHMRLYFDTASRCHPGWAFGSTERLPASRPRMVFAKIEK